MVLGVEGSVGGEEVGGEEEEENLGGVEEGRVGREGCWTPESVSSWSERRWRDIEGCEMLWTGRW